ncbi:MAG TPA: hypothetical protein VNO55_16340, partial [Polyangia bacterium]|nr:hypothetical protein [Polyangia bacterium]
MSVLLPFAVFLVGACGVSKGAGSTGSGGHQDSGRDVSVGSTGGGEATGAGGLDGAQDASNTAGLGPAAVNLGAATNLAAAGSYVLLAKTGITNVTGSSITGGHLGISPAAASFITGFSLIADSTNLFAT